MREELLNLSTNIEKMINDLESEAWENNRKKYVTIKCILDELRSDLKEINITLLGIVDENNYSTIKDDLNKIKELVEKGSIDSSEVSGMLNLLEKDTKEINMPSTDIDLNNINNTINSLNGIESDLDLNGLDAFLNNDAN